MNIFMVSQNLGDVDFFLVLQEKLLDGLVFYGPKLLMAILTLVVGLWLVKRIDKILLRGFDNARLDPSLKPFLRSSVRLILRLLLIVTVISMVGVEMTSIFAILGAASLAVGMALSGTLQNVAGGVVILVLKPFRVGDEIEAQGNIGKVHSIQVFTTHLLTGDNKRVVLPNGPLANGNIINYSFEKLRRVDFTFSIAYGDDYKKARDLVLVLISEDPKILSEPAPFIGLGEMGQSSVDIRVRVWAKTEDNSAVQFLMNEKVYERFPANGLTIPFPQLEVHLNQSRV